MASPSDRPRVLVVTNMYPTPDRPYSGIFVARQLGALSRLGVDLNLVVVSGERGPADYVVARGRVRDAIRRYEPTLLHAHFGYTALASSFMGLPDVLTVCGDDLNGTSNARGRITVKSRAGILLTQLLAASATKVLVMSASMLGQLWPVTRAKAEILPYGVDDELFSPGSAQTARTRLNIPHDGVAIAFVHSGRQLTKRLDLAQATCRELVSRGVHAHLLVAQDVQPEDMPWYYRAADCLLMTSDLEGSPNCVKEALACGLPVVSVPVGDVPTLINRPERGRIVPRDAVKLALAVHDVVKRAPARRDSLLPPQYRSSHVAGRLLDVYRDIAVKTSGPAGGRDRPRPATADT